MYLSQTVKSESITNWYSRAFVLTMTPPGHKDQKKQKHIKVNR